MFSYSKISTHDTCPYQYYLKYKLKLEPVPDNSPSNALYLGTACHLGIEKRSIDAAIESYKSNYNTLWTEENDLEVYKLRSVLEKAIKEIPEGEYEYKLFDPDGFIGFIDELVKNSDGTYTLYDFKYSNREDKYKRSGQLHIYKYYYEKLTGNIVRDMYYILIPKATKTLKESITEELKNKELKYLPIEYDKKQISYFFAKKALMDRSDKEGKYEKRYSTNCKWCDFSKYCSSCGKDLSELTKESIQKLSTSQEPKYTEVQLF